MDSDRSWKASSSRPRGANEKLKLLLIAMKGLGCVTSSVSPVKEAKHRHNEKNKRRDEKFDKRTQRLSRRWGTPGKAEASPAIAGVCCGPGILLSLDAASVDCVQSRRRPPAVTTQQTSEVVFHFSPLFEGSPCAYDRFREWRLATEDMSYEELLDLGERIGYECTGLKKNEMVRCLRKAKSRMEEMLPLLLHDGGEWKCSICQDGFESGDETGRLECGHSYHVRCLKQWLRCKNSCPICKGHAVPHN